MRNSTLVTASVSVIGGGIWVGIEGSLLLMLATVLVYMAILVARRLYKDDNEPGALKAARALNPQWDEDMEVCNEMMRKGSKSFFTASKLLPSWMRPPTLALYAYCRHGDDTIDDGPQDTKIADLKRLHARLDAAYDKTVPVASLPCPVERTFAAVVRGFDVPKCLPLALLEGFEWDMYDDMEDSGRYETIEDTIRRHRPGGARERVQLGRHARAHVEEAQAVPPRGVVHEEGGGPVRAVQRDARG